MAISRRLGLLTFFSLLCLAGCAGSPPPQNQAQQTATAVPEMPSSRALADYMSSGNVQVYDLNGPTDEDVTDFAGTIDDRYEGYAYAGDASVTVYSLDRQERQPPGMMPPSRSEYRSPFQHGEDVLVPDEGTTSWADSPGVEPDFYQVRDPLAYAAGGADRRVANRGKLGKIYFGHGGTHLDQADKKILSHIVDEMSRQPGTIFVIEGHASRRAEASDPTQKRLLNLKTSLDRAYHVSRELITRGVPASSLRTVGVGDTEPGTGVSDMSVERASRRVEIYKATSR